jgi:uracil-DNA glycosylase
MIQIGNDWDAVLKEENGKEYFMKLQEFLAEERQTHMVYPPEKDVFNALKYSSLADTKVVIFGQDPYHEPGQAHGMCFSVNKGIAVPPSLINIYKEIETDLGIKPPSHGYLADWAGQGVLLLNTVLTVRRGEANSHRGKGWKPSRTE